MALVVTIALHVALVAGLLAIKVVEKVSQYTTPIQLRDIKDVRKPIPDVKPIVPVLGKPVAVPQTVPDLPDFPADDALVATIVDLPQDVPSADARRIDNTPSLPDTPLRYQAVRPSDDYYPPQAIRMAAEGATIVRTCVDAGGRLSGAPSVVTSSRQSLLDAAAVKWANEALRFRPATRAGVAIASCKEFRVSFTLH
jgi:TonB family protein